MTTDMLLLAVLAAMTIVAIMVAINSHGRWRATISSLLAIFLLGGAAWAFILQYTTKVNPGREPAGTILNILHSKDRTHLNVQENCDSTTAAYLIAQVNAFADTLVNARLHNPTLNHEQLVAHANSVGSRFELLKTTVNSHKAPFVRFPEAEQLLKNAMTELNAACHFYHSYYFAENTESEQSIERLFRQRAQNAADSLAKARSAVRQNGG